MDSQLVPSNNTSCLRSHCLEEGLLYVSGTDHNHWLDLSNHLLFKWFEITMERVYSGTSFHWDELTMGRV